MNKSRSTNKKPGRAKDHPPVANRLWRYRKGLELSQKQVASRLGHKSSAHVSRWENGKKTPSLDNALMLAHVLETPVESLFADRASELRARLSAPADKKSGDQIP